MWPYWYYFALQCIQLSLLNMYLVLFLQSMSINYYSEKRDCSLAIVKQCICFGPLIHLGCHFKSLFAIYYAHLFITLWSKNLMSISFIEILREIQKGVLTTSSFLVWGSTLGKFWNYFYIFYIYSKNLMSIFICINIYEGTNFERLRNSFLAINVCNKVNSRIICSILQNYCWKIWIEQKNFSLLFKFWKQRLFFQWRKEFLNILALQEIR